MSNITLDIFTWHIMGIISTWELIYVAIMELSMTDGRTMIKLKLGSCHKIASQS